MKDIRIFPICVDSACITEKDLYARFPIDMKRFRFVIDRNDPQYLLVVISHVFSRESLRELFRNYYSRDRIVLFEGDEAISPDMNIFDYAITYDDSFEYNDRVCHRPYSYFVAGGMEIRRGNHLSYHEAAREYDNRKFCSFIYSNANAHYRRDELFYEISSYKKVDSLGKHLNNTNNVPDRNIENWFKSSIDQKREYRFSICAENGEMSGYTSEKILSSFLANSIPIYWGNPNIASEFNPEAFINCSEMDNVGDVVDKVREVEENKEIWINMATAQWQTDKQRIYIRRQEEEYKRFLNSIFEQNIADAKRCPTTTAAYAYVDFALRK